MTAYEEQRSRHLARWAELLGDRMGRLAWDRARIDAHRTEALRALVAAAKAGSPWHADRLAGVDPAALDAGDLSGLPTMSKADLMANFDDVVTDRRVTLAGCEAHLAGLTDDRYFLDDLHVVASGGSSGERGVFVYGWEGWVDVHLGLARRVIDDLFTAPPAENGTRVALVAAANATHMTTAVASTFASPAVDIRAFPVSLPVPEIVAGLNATQPGSLTTYASMLGILAAEAAAGRLRISPRRVVATSEPLLPEVRAAAEAAFGAPVANVWGTSEGGVVAVGCWQDEGMHLNEDLVVVEPVDAEGRPVAPGERSAKVLLTNLCNPTQPLLRYELTDEVVLLDEPCPCGSAHRRVADVQGRLDDVFRYADVALHPHVLRSVLAHHPEVLEYQVRQTPVGVDVSVVASGAAGPSGEVLAKELSQALVAAGVAGAAATVSAVPSLERHASTGKLRRFVPLAA